MLRLGCAECGDDPLRGLEQDQRGDGKVLSLQARVGNHNSSDATTRVEALGVILVREGLAHRQDLGSWRLGPYGLGSEQRPRRAKGQRNPANAPGKLK